MKIPGSNTNQSGIPWLGDAISKLSPKNSNSQSAYALSEPSIKIIMTALIVIFYFEFVLIGGLLAKWIIGILISDPLSIGAPTEYLSLTYTMLAALALAALMAISQGNPLITYVMASYNLGGAMLLWDQSWMIALPAAMTAAGTFGLFYFQKHEPPSIVRKDC